MQPFLVINRHPPEECESIAPAIQHPPAHLKGTRFYCPCAHGEHSFYMVVEGNSAEEVLQGLPPEMQRGTRAVGLDIFDL